MAKLPNETTAILWDALKWESGPLTMNSTKNTPIEVTAAPQTAGLYRISLIEESIWNMSAKRTEVGASPKIQDSVIDLSRHELPVILTLGKTTNIFKRLRQHFGTNEKNNRLLRRLRGFLPEMSDDEVRAAACESFRVEWVSVDDWVARSLLENYGTAVLRPVFDIGAEH